MASTIVGASHDSGAAGNTSTALLATIPAGATLVKATVQGYATLPSAAVSWATGIQFAYDIQAGLQHGAQGYGGVALTTASPSGASWITYGNLIPAATNHQNIAGSSPVTAQQVVMYGLDLEWKGQIVYSSAMDVYLCVGTLTTEFGSAAFRTQYNWALEYATFP